MNPYVHEEAMFERLDVLKRELEASRLTAQGVRGWGTLLHNLGARAWLLGGLAMRRRPRWRRVPTHHPYEDTTASDVA